MAPAGCGWIETQEGVLHRKIQYLIVHFLHFKVRVKATTDLVEAGPLEVGDHICLHSWDLLDEGPKEVRGISKSGWTAAAPERVAVLESHQAFPLLSGIGNLES